MDKLEIWEDHDGVREAEEGEEAEEGGEEGEGEGDEEEHFWTAADEFRWREEEAKRAVQRAAELKEKNALKGMAVEGAAEEAPAVDDAPTADDAPAAEPAAVAAAAAGAPAPKDADPAPEVAEPKAEAGSAGEAVSVGESPPIEMEVDTPKADESMAEEATTVEPKIEEPIAVEPTAEEPKAEETKAVETKAVTPKAEAPKADEPKAEEPAAVETEEPIAVEPKIEEPNADTRRSSRGHVAKRFFPDEVETASRPRAAAPKAAPKVEKATAIKSEAVPATGAESKAKAKEAKAEAKMEAKTEVKAEAKALTPVRRVSERPEGALRLRGLLVPSSSESETATWRGVDTTQVLGWMSQHTGTQRLQSLWVRTAHAWYWLRRKDLFAPAHIYRPFWTLPGNSSASAISERHLMASPVAAAYAHSEAPPPRSAGATASAVKSMPPYAAADEADAALGDSPRAFRLSSFMLRAAPSSAAQQGGTLDLFSALPQGVFPASASDAPLFSLVGQLMPNVGLADRTADGGAEVVYPSRIWVSSLPVHEWRFQLGAARDALGRGGSGRVWVRSEGVWYMLHKPHSKVASEWSPPGSRQKPLSDALLGSAFDCDATPRLGTEGLPCRELTHFSAADEAGVQRSLLSVLEDSGRKDAVAVRLLGQVVCAGERAGADEPGAGQPPSAAAASLWVRTDVVIGGNMDYSVAPAALWLRTSNALYRLLEPSLGYASLASMPGLTRGSPLPESAANALLELYQHKVAHPFQSKKGAFLASLKMDNFEVNPPRPPP